MTNLYAIHAFENQYGGLHGRENICVAESEGFEDIKMLANEMSEEVIYEWNYDHYGEVAVEQGYEEGSDEYEEFCLDCLREDTAYEIYKIIDTKGLSCEELDAELCKLGIELFVEEYCDKNPVWE